VKKSLLAKTSGAKGPKMATIKQCKMLAARSKAAGMEYDFERFKELTNGDVDAELQEIEDYIAQSQRPVQKQQKKQPEFSQIRLGMAEKLVIQSYPLKWCLENPTEFKRTVRELYELLSDTEGEVCASLSSSSSQKFAEYEKQLKADPIHSGFGTPTSRRETNDAIIEFYDHSDTFKCNHTFVQYDDSVVKCTRCGEVI